MILCNPHNPTGMIWTREELGRIGELCAANHVKIMSDEIHCDLTEPGYGYIPFASVSETCAQNSITCIAPTKAFNLAGLQTAAVKMCIRDRGTASLVNVILDPILIFGYFGFPAMGTAGAAAATVTGQLAGGLLGIYLNIKRNKEIPVHFTLHIQKKYVANILKVGIPTAIVQGIMSVMGIFINTILYQFSSTAVAIYGILMKVQNLAQIGVQGMNNGLIPIIAYNYGAGKEKRIHETIRYAFLYAVIIMTVVLISLELIPDKILMLFDASEQMIRLGIPAVRIMSVSFFVSSVGIIFAAIFQGFGNGNYSMYLAFMRQVILLIPILLIGAAIGNITVIWSGFAVAEALSIPFGMWLYGKVTQNMIAPMAETYGENRVETA